MLTEQVEEGKGRVDLPDDGYLLEFNQRYLRDDEPGFRTRRGTPIAFKDPDEITKQQRREVRRAVIALREGALRPGLRRPGDRLRGVRQRPQAHRLVPRRGALRQPGLQLPVERQLQLGAREALRLRPRLGLRPQRRHPVAGSSQPRQPGTPASGATGSPGCCRTRRSPRGSRAGGPGSSRSRARWSPRSRPQRRRWPLPPRPTGPSGTPRATWSGPTTAATARPRSTSSRTGSPSGSSG